MARPRQEIIDNPIPTSLFFNGVYSYTFTSVLKIASPVPKQQNSCIAHKQRCRDRVINDFLSRCRHLLVPLLFHEVTSLHPPSFQRNDFSTCKLSTTILSVSRKSTYFTNVVTASLKGYNNKSHINAAVNGAPVAVAINLLVTSDLACMLISSYQVAHI